MRPALRHQSAPGRRDHAQQPADPARQHGHARLVQPEVRPAPPRIRFAQPLAPGAHAHGPVQHVPHALHHDRGIHRHRGKRPCGTLAVRPHSVPHGRRQEHLVRASARGLGNALCARRHGLGRGGPQLRISADQPFAHAPLVRQHAAQQRPRPGHRPQAHGRFHLVVRPGPAVHGLDPPGRPHVRRHARHEPLRILSSVLRGMGHLHPPDHALVLRPGRVGLPARPPAPHALRPMGGAASSRSAACTTWRSNAGTRAAPAAKSGRRADGAARRECSWH